MDDHTLQKVVTGATYRLSKASASSDDSCSPKVIVLTPPAGCKPEQNISGKLDMNQTSK